MDNKSTYTAVLTVVGKDRSGIIAEVSAILAKHQVNIQDISQTIVADIFNMIMLVDSSKMDVSHKELTTELNAKGEEIGCQITYQEKDVFQAMHRI